MKKIIQLVALMLSVASGSVFAQQDTLFYGPDTVCIGQPVNLTSRYVNQSSYYWNFCSGYYDNFPVGFNLGSGFSFNHPANIDVARDPATGDYFGFVVNAATTELIRLNYGKSLDNIPTVTNFGNLQNALPTNPTSLFMLRDTFSGYWYLFVAGGYTAASSTLARVDFGASLSNPAPNIANFGNLFGLFDYPKGIFIAQDANNQWYGYMVNHNTNHIIYLQFSYNISNTPLAYDGGNPSGTLNLVTDMAGIKFGGNWYLFATNSGSNTLVRIDLGTTLDTLGSTTITPANLVGTDLGNFNFRILAPSSIAIGRDCGKLFAYVTDSTTNQLINIEMTTPQGPFVSRDYGDLGFMNLPTGISSIIRDSDNLYAFVCNEGDNSLTKIEVQQCHNASIHSFNEVTPPTYYYDTAGTFNIYYIINEGLPTADVQCRVITVIPNPADTMSPNVTICQGDTTKLWDFSSFADSIVWTKPYNSDTTFLRWDSVRVWPQYSTWYPVIRYYPHGCTVRDSVKVNVSNVWADAGYDRTIIDGAATVLGGPNMPISNSFSYNWQPYQFLSDTALPFPSATPPYDYTYVLTVTELTDDLGCTAKDTVTIHVSCGDFQIPNVFAPNSPNSGVNRFGILNNMITHLQYLRIYDRWGALVFSTTDVTQRWDGTFNGNQEPEGVYVWEADGYCLDGTRITKKGNVTLIK
jgi:gliding motility-associated-like protein